MGNLIATLFKYGLMLSLAGEVAGVTIDMCSRAQHATKHGIISLTAINRALMGNPKR